MSNLWLNLRLGGWFVQWAYGAWLPKVGRPSIVAGYDLRRHEPLVELYELRWPW